MTCLACDLTSGRIPALQMQMFDDGSAPADAEVEAVADRARALFHRLA